MFVSNQEPTELAKPGVGSFDNSAALIAAEFSSVAVATLLVVLAIRNNQLDAAFLKPLAQRVGVIGTVSDDTFRLLSRTALGPGDFDLGERGLRKRSFSWRGTFVPNSQWKTAAVDQNHPLCALAALGFANGGAPFFPERSCRSETSLPSSAAPCHPVHRAALARRPARHLVLPTASAAASRSMVTDTCPVKTAMPLPSATPTGCLPGRPGSKPMAGHAYPYAALARATEAPQLPTVHSSTTRIASCSLKKFSKISTL